MLNKYALMKSRYNWYEEIRGRERDIIKVSDNKNLYSASFSKKMNIGQKDEKKKKYIICMCEI